MTADTPATFRGPYADGPPADALRIDTPPIDAITPATAARFLVIVLTLVGFTLKALALQAVRLPRRRITTTWCDTTASGAVDAFERLGPTWVKLGQLVASSPGVFPQPLADACQRTLDTVPPFTASVARQIIRDDLGHDPDDLFATFDDTPLAAASVGQVHACTLRDGRRAVLKLQRPGIRRLFTLDLQVLYRLARLASRVERLKAANLVDVIRDLHEVTFCELNPALEAQRQHDFLALIASFDDNPRVTAPRIYWDHCGPRTICMERVDGIRMDAFDQLTDRGLDGAELLRCLAKVWVEGVCVHGTFHGDVHAGNLWVLDDDRCCLLDFGIMGNLPADWQGFMRDLLYTTMIDNDFTRVARAGRALGVIPSELGTDEELGQRLHMIMASLLADGMVGLDLADILTMCISVAGDYQTSFPKEMVLVVKQLAYIERYAKTLAPDYVLIRDLHLIRNVFPDAVTQAAAERGITLPA